MFEKLRMLWKGDAPLEEQYREFGKMLNLDRELYDEVVNALQSGANLRELEDTIYRGDIQINKLERKIRKQLVLHLSANPGVEITSCLILMSIVKDAERLGDLCKNLYESAIMWGQPISNLSYAAKINEFQLYVSEAFGSTIEAFDAEDDAVAGEIIQDEVKWNKRFDSFLVELSESDIPAKEAVCTTLLVRNFKRIQAHLSNIASSVVLPLHRIDHRPKHLREDGPNES